MHPLDDGVLAQSGELIPGSLVLGGEHSNQWGRGIKEPKGVLEGRLGVVEDRQYIRSEGLD